MSEYIAKASIEPRDYRVVFLIQEKSRSINFDFSRGENTISLFVRYAYILVKTCEGIVMKK